MDVLVDAAFVLDECEEMYMSDGKLVSISGASTPLIGLVRCEDCRYNPLKPRPYYSDDLISHYFWCWKFAEANEFCPRGREREDNVTE